MCYNFSKISEEPTVKFLMKLKLQFLPVFFDFFCEDFLLTFIWVDCKTFDRTVIDFYNSTILDNSVLTAGRALKLRQKCRILMGVRFYETFSRGMTHCACANIC